MGSKTQSCELFEMFEIWCCLLVGIFLKPCSTLNLSLELIENSKTLQQNFELAKNFFENRVRQRFAESAEVSCDGLNFSVKDLVSSENDPH